MRVGRPAACGLAPHILLRPPPRPPQACALVTEKVNPSLADIGRPPGELDVDFPFVGGLRELEQEWWPQAGDAGEPNEVRGL